MKCIHFLNILLILTVLLFIPNEFLIYNSIYFYLFQIFLLIPILISKLKYVRNIFLPSFFVLFYFIVNQCLGSYLVPRGFGFNNWFEPYLAQVKNYNYITSYLLLSNYVLFVTCLISLKRTDRIDTNNFNYRSKKDKHLFVKLIFGTLLFFGLSTLEFYSKFSLQLIVLVIIVNYLVYNRFSLRILVYLFILSLMVIYNFENKREVIVVLFAIILIETLYSRILLKFNTKRLIAYFLVVATFILLIISSSILRGYGGFETNSFREAVILVPEYVKSEVFVDGITDNLELNYNYGTGTSAMNLIIEGELNYQFGLTLLKVFFLPIPRSIVKFKPESTMQMYTKKFNPSFWNEGGSLPVILPVDMFINFHLLGVFFIYFLMRIFDNIFIKVLLFGPKYKYYFSALFFIVTILLFARGSGLELYILNYLFCLPIVLIFSVTKKLRRNH